MAKALVHFSDGLKQANMVVNHHAPPTTSQSVFPVADQRLPFTSVWILRGSCGGNRRTPLTGNAFFHKEDIPPL